ncbi:hypothetical protein [Streptomyces nanshensis]|uniref:hypothetical protein n=1 Tax=Streptomyces nanshensis TaxID=518642 RepID=UPI00085C801A|nr:hypothetical protein [Streptomyces nanshensis]
MAKLLARLAAVAALVLIALSVAVPAHAVPGSPNVKPPAPVPAEFAANPGVDKVTGHYCSQDDPDPKKKKRCRPLTAGEASGTVEQGEGSADKQEARAYELRQLKKWQARQKDHTTKHYKQLNAYITKCLADKNDHRTFTYCAGKGRAEHPPPAKDPDDWLKEKVAQIAGGAFEDLAEGMGAAVVWLLKQFAASFEDVAAVDLASSGIGPIMGITTALSTIAGTFLLLIQWGRVAATQDGEAAATAILGLVKFGLILPVYATAAQAALHWSHVLSTSLIDFSFKKQGIEEQLQTAFGSLVGTGGAATAGGFLITGSGVAPAAAGAIIVLAAIALIAIFALWLEMLMREAGIDILLVVMPLVLAGQVAHATSDWWPRARSALIALILMEPTITLIFSIGFGPMSDGKGIQSVLVGVLIFVTAGFSPYVLTRFVIVNGSDGGTGSGAGSGLLSTLGSSASSAMGGYQPLPSGAGMIAGGGHALAVEADTAAHGGRSAAGKKAFGGAFLQGAGLALQAAAVGKDVLESTAASTASYAGLGPGASGGRHVVVNRRGAASRTQPRSHGQDADVVGPVEEDLPPQYDAAPPVPQPPEDPAPPPSGEEGE